MPVHRICLRRGAQTILAFALLLPLGPGCAGQRPTPQVEQIEQTHLPFIEDGATSREQALLRLGIPSGQFEGERILTWRLRFDGKALFPIAPDAAGDDPRYAIWTASAFNLVLVFDAANVLQRHSFIEVK